MKYLIYRITNNINGKIYVGAHATLDENDGYMGSGVNIVKSIKKYGIKNFSKEILYVFDNSVEMYAKEAEIVTEEFVLRIDTYNAALGGRGNPVIVHLQDPAYRVMISERTKAGMTPEIRAAISAARLGSKQSPEHKKSISEGIKKYAAENGGNRKGSVMSDAHKAAITKKLKGKKLKFNKMSIKGIEFDRYEIAGEHFGVSYKTISNWVKDPKREDCFFL